MESPSPLSPPKQFLAVFGPTRTFPTDLMMMRTGDEDGSDEGSIGMKLSYLESITEEEDSSSDAMEECDDGDDDEEIFPVIESAPEEGLGGGGMGYFDDLFSERGTPLVPFGPDAANSEDFESIIGSDTDHFGRPTASRPPTPAGDKKKIEFAAAQTGCIDCVVGSAGHNHGPAAGRLSPAPPTPAPSRSSSVKLKEPPLSPVQEERGDAIEEKILDTTLTTLTTLTPDTTPLKQQEPNSFVTTNETKETATLATATLSEQTPPAKSSYPLPERPKLSTTNIYPITPARQQRPQIPPTPPTTPARRNLYSRELTPANVRDVAPAGTLTPPPSEVASSVIEEQPKKEAGEAEPGHGEDGHSCPFLRRSASGRELPHSLSYSYSAPSTPEPVQIPEHSKSSPEVPRLSTHFHSGPSTPSPEASRLLSYNRTRPMTPRVFGRGLSQENSDRSLTPEIVFSGSGLASPFMDVSEPASRAPSPPPPSLAEGSTTTTPAASVILPPTASATTSRSPLAPAIALKGDSGASTQNGPAKDDKPQLPTPESIAAETIYGVKFFALDAVRIVELFAEWLGYFITIPWVVVIPFTLLLWTSTSIAKMFIPADEGSALAAFNPVYAMLLYFVLFIVVALYLRGESHDVYDDILRVTRKTFSRRKLRRAGIALLAASAVAGAMFAVVAAAPHIAALTSRLATYAVNRYSPPPPSPPPPVLEPWEADMDFVYFAPTGAEEKAMHMASAMEPGAYGPYYPGMEGEETGKGVRWGDLLRIGVVLVMGPAGAMALRRRTL